METPKNFEIDGVEHEYRSHKQNEADGFDYHNCRSVEFKHPLGTIYKFDDYYYVPSGPFWYRFPKTELKKIKL